MYINVHCGIGRLLGVSSVASDLMFTNPSTETHITFWLVCAHWSDCAMSFLVILSCLTQQCTIPVPRGRLEWHLWASGVAIG